MSDIRPERETGDTPIGLKEKNINNNSKTNNAIFQIRLDTL